MVYCTSIHAKSYDDRQLEVLSFVTTLGGIASVYLLQRVAPDTLPGTARPEPRELSGHV